MFKNKIKIPIFILSKIYRDQNNLTSIFFIIYILYKKLVLRALTEVYVRFKLGLSPRMHQTSNNRYNPNGLQVTSIACGLEAPKRHGKNTAFLSIYVLPIPQSVIINNKDLLKHCWFSTFMHIYCKHDWNNFLLLITNALLIPVL